MHCALQGLLLGGGSASLSGDETIGRLARRAGRIERAAAGRWAVAGPCVAGSLGAADAAWWVSAGSGSAPAPHGAESLPGPR